MGVIVRRRRFVHGLRGRLQAVSGSLLCVRLRLNCATGKMPGVRPGGRPTSLVSPTLHVRIVVASLPDFCVNLGASGKGAL